MSVFSRKKRESHELREGKTNGSSAPTPVQHPRTKMVDFDRESSSEQVNISPMAFVERRAMSSQALRESDSSQRRLSSANGMQTCSLGAITAGVESSRLPPRSPRAGRLDEPAAIFSAVEVQTPSAGRGMKKHGSRHSKESPRRGKESPRHVKESPWPQDDRRRGSEKPKKGPEPISAMQVGDVVRDGSIAKEAAAAAAAAGAAQQQQQQQQPSTGSATRPGRRASMCESADMEGSVRPVSRKTSSLSTLQQKALEKTSLSFSRRHTPPPSFMREMVRKGGKGPDRKKNVSLLVLEGVPEMTSMSLDDLSINPGSARAQFLSPGSDSTLPASASIGKLPAGRASVDATPAPRATPLIKAAEVKVPSSAKGPKPVAPPPEEPQVPSVMKDRQPVLMIGGGLNTRRLSAKESEMIKAPVTPATPTGSEGSLRGPYATTTVQPLGPPGSGGRGPRPVPAPSPAPLSPSTSLNAVPPPVGSTSAPAKGPRPVSTPTPTPTARTKDSDAVAEAQPRPASRGPKPVHPPPDVPLPQSPSVAAQSPSKRACVGALMEDEDDLFQMAPAGVDPHSVTIMKAPPARAVADSEEDEEDDEDLLVGFRPDEFAARRGARKVNHIRFYLDPTRPRDSFSSIPDDYDEDADFFVDGDGNSLPAVKPTVTNDGAELEARRAFFVPTYTAIDCVGDPYTYTADGKPLGRRSSVSVLADPDEDASELSISKIGAKPPLPKPLPSIFAGMSEKFRPDPAKIHRPLPNTFGIRKKRGSSYDYNNDDDDDDDEPEDEEEWYWEEVEEDEEADAEGMEVM